MRQRKIRGGQVLASKYMLEGRHAFEAVAPDFLMCHPHGDRVEPLLRKRVEHLGIGRWAVRWRAGITADQIHVDRLGPLRDLHAHVLAEFQVRDRQLVAGECDAGVGQGSDDLLDVGRNAARRLAKQVIAEPLELRLGCVWQRRASRQGSCPTD